MWLWVGLGNPGKKYNKTRHNAGILLLQTFFPNMQPEKFEKVKGEICEETFGEKIKILFPLTYMNLSGDSVSRALSYFQIKPSQMIVFHDEIELSPGEIRYKFGGGHKGHNGLRDIIQKIHSSDFHRIRIGIGRPQNPNYSVSDYVLSKMPLQDLPTNENLEAILKEHELLPGKLEMTERLRS